MANRFSHCSLVCWCHYAINDAHLPLNAFRIQKRERTDFALVNLTLGDSHKDFAKNALSLCLIASSPVISDVNEPLSVN